MPIEMLGVERVEEEVGAETMECQTVIPAMQLTTTTTIIPTVVLAVLATTTQTMEETEEERITLVVGVEEPEEAAQVAEATTFVTSAINLVIGQMLVQMETDIQCIHKYR